MKKTLSLILALALVVSCVFVVASAADEPSAYLWLKGEYTGNTDTDVQPGINWIFDNSTGILENGKTYTAFATAKYDEGSVGTVYCNVYVYNDYEAAKNGDWTHLMNFLDFASCAIDNGGWQWTDFEKSWVFSDNGYGGANVTAGDAIAAVTIGIGFWQASGGISVSEIGFKDTETDEVIWSQTFSEGLYLDSVELLNHYLVIGDEGNSWGVVGADITLPDESEEEPVYPAEKGKNIAVGKSYTTENYTVRDDGYGDPAAVKLTDGVKDDAGSAAPAGFNFAEGANSASIIVDLGEVTEIAAIIADLQGGNWGIPNPATYSVSFAISADGQTYDDLGTVNGADADVVDPSESDSDWGVTNFECTCFNGTSARYVKVTYNKPEGYTGNHCWPSEIQIFDVAAADEPSEEPSEADPENPPKTGDNGMIALAVISVIALAGAVVVKKSK